RFRSRPATSHPPSTLSSLTPHFFFFHDPSPTEIHPLSLHDALPISQRGRGRPGPQTPPRRRSATGARPGTHTLPRRTTRAAPTITSGPLRRPADDGPPVPEGSTVNTLTTAVRNRLVSSGTPVSPSSVAAALRAEGGVLGDAELLDLTRRLSAELSGAGPLEELML